MLEPRTKTYVPGFKHDVFISYAHVDNLSFTDDEGWVAGFHRSLEISLAHRLGRLDIFSVWRDRKLHGNDEWEDTIDAACRDSAVGVFVLSPGFVASDRCRRELEALATTEKAKGRSRPAISRLFKVHLSAVADRDVPERLRTVNGYPFHAIDPITGHEERFRRTREPDSDQRYWNSLGDLARDLAAMLQEMRGFALGVAANSPPPGPVVFLAEVTDDLVQEREDLRRSLVQGGVRVFPEKPLPTTTEELLSRLREDLVQARFSVHLIGSFYGRRPVGEARSFTHVQYDQAGEVGVPRLLWVPREVDPKRVREAEQRNLLAVLESEPDSAHPAELLKIGLEEMKELLLSRLFPPAEKPLPETPGALVYISCCRPEDDVWAHDLCAALRSARHDVVLRVRKGERTELENDKHHLANLRYCDALLVLYATASVDWVRNELIKARRARRGAGFVMSVYESPSPPDKEELGLEFGNLVVLRCRDVAGPERLRPLLDRLREVQV